MPLHLLNSPLEVRRQLQELREANLWDYISRAFCKLPPDTLHGSTSLLILLPHRRDRHERPLSKVYPEDHFLDRVKYHAIPVPVDERENALDFPFRSRIAHTDHAVHELAPSEEENQHEHYAKEVPCIEDNAHEKITSSALPAPFGKYNVPGHVSTAVHIDESEGLLHCSSRVDEKIEEVVGFRGVRVLIIAVVPVLGGLRIAGRL